MMLLHHVGEDQHRLSAFQHPAAFLHHLSSGIPQTLDGGRKIPRLKQLREQMQTRSMQTRPSLWRLTFFNVQPVWPALNQDLSTPAPQPPLTHSALIKCSGGVKLRTHIYSSFSVAHPRRNINTLLSRCVHHVVSQPPIQMEQSFHRLFLEALTIL